MLRSERFRRDLEQRRAHNERQKILKLPGELRNYIWDLALPSSSLLSPSRRLGYQIDSHQNSQDVFRISGTIFQGDDKMPKCSCVMHICQQTRNESLSIFYASKTFVVGVGERHQLQQRYGDCLPDFGMPSDEISLTKKWIRSIGATALSHLRHLVVVEVIMDEDILQYGQQLVGAWKTISLDLKHGTASAIENDDEGGLAYIREHAQKEVNVVMQQGLLKPNTAEEKMTADKLLDILEALSTCSDVQKAARGQTGTSRVTYRRRKECLLFGGQRSY